MLTIELKIKSTSNLPLIEDYCYQYTGLFYKLYNNPELLVDPSTKIELLQKYNLLNVFMYDCCVEDVKTKLKQYETNQKNKVKELESITKELEENDFKGKRGRTKKYSLLKKQRYLQRTLGKNSCFGGKANLRKITKYSQFIQSLDKQIKVESEKTKLANLVKQKEESLDLLSKVKEEFHENRKLGIYIIGAANKVGNRNYNFDLTNNKLTFKPNKDNHVDIEFYEPRGKKLVQTLSVLQAMSDERMIPLTVRLTADKVYITYNEELIAGYSFDQKGCTTEQKGVVDKEVRTEIFKKYKAEQDSRKLKDKLPYRYMSVDLNPFEIGLTVADIKGNNFTLVYKEVIKLDGLSTKLGLSSDHPKTIKQNNKRKFELTEAWAYIFRKAVHYRVGRFVMEDLDFKPTKLDSKEGNRQTKNLWHRTLTTNLISKYCNQLGIIKIEVNPCYSSFIGNLVYKEYDPIAASLELMRRGMVKYIKGSTIYPPFTRITNESLAHLFSETIGSGGTTTWVAMYKSVNCAGMRYRNKDDSFLSSMEVHSLSSGKSKVVRHWSYERAEYECL